MSTATALPISSSGPLRPIPTAPQRCLVCGVRQGGGLCLQSRTLPARRRHGFQINGEAAGDFSGHSVAGAGDVNGDGFADLIIGAYGADPNGSLSGASYVVYGSRPLIDVLRQGTEIANRINGGHGADTLQGFSGNDTLIGWEDDDLLAGGSGKGTLTGGSGDDTLVGNGGSDRLNGGSGDDSLRGGSASDRLDGGNGYDRLNGGSGNDTFLASTGHDTLNGSSGADLVNIGAHFNHTAVVDLAAGTAHFGGANTARLYDIENVIGTKAADNIAGDGVANRLTGGGGKDTLAGVAGNDTLDGKGGNDRLNGAATTTGSLAETATTRSSAPAARIPSPAGTAATSSPAVAAPTILISIALPNSAPGTQRDHITDFAKGTERVDLAGIDAKAGVAGNQAFHVITGTFTGHKGELRSTNVGPNSRVAGDVDGDGHADFSILVENVNNLHAVDFVL